MPSLTIHLSEMVVEPVKDFSLSPVHEQELKAVETRIRNLGRQRPLGRPADLPAAVARFVEANQPELEQLSGMGAADLIRRWGVFPVQDDLGMAMKAFRPDEGLQVEGAQQEVLVGCVARVLAAAAQSGMPSLPFDEKACRLLLQDAMGLALGRELGQTAEGPLQMEAGAYRALRSALLSASRLMALLQAWIAPWEDAQPGGAQPATASTMAGEGAAETVHAAPPLEQTTVEPVAETETITDEEEAVSATPILAPDAPPVPDSSPWASWARNWLELAQQILLEQGQEARAVFQREIPNAQISVPVDPPRHLLQGAPLYDNLNLTVRVAPFMAEALRIMMLTGNSNETIHPDGRAVTLKAWSQTRDVDLRRLTDLFRSLRETGRRSLQRFPVAEDVSDVTALMASLGLEPLPNVAPCWGRRPEAVALVVGLRPVAHFHEGVLPLRRRLQICVVMGRDLGKELPLEIQDQLTHRGSLGTWSQEGLRFVSIEMEEKPEDLLRQTFIAFLALAVELQETLKARGLVDTTQMVDWLPRLNLLPMRLETDFPRLSRQWRRQRLAQELRDAARSDLAAAKRLVYGVEDQEERHHLRAILVTIRAADDLEAAVEELAQLGFGTDRHDALLAVLEACSASGQEEERKAGLQLLGNRVFDLWLSHDARQESTTWDCLPFLDLAGDVLGLEVLFKGWEGDISPAVACDWLVHTLRRSPRSRMDPAWLTRLDQLVHGGAGRTWGPGDLNRLLALLETMCRHNLPGRDGLAQCIGDVGKRHEPCRSYAEQRLNELCAGKQLH